MINYDKWCDSAQANIKNHEIRILTGRDADRDQAISLIAKKVPSHFASEEHLARVLKKLGKAKAAKFIEDKLPQTDNIRSGDLGEILACEYVEESTDYDMPIKRLRYKDHREMSMRGDDLIGVKMPEGKNPLGLLKGEIKSRVALTTAVVDEARKALRSNEGRPSPHALSFVAARLHDAGNHGPADVIDDAQLKHGIKLNQVAHLLFTFTGNDPKTFLENNLNAYTGRVKQHGVGLRVKGHKAFVKAVYEKVAEDGNDG